MENKTLVVGLLVVAVLCVGVAGYFMGKSNGVLVGTTTIGPASSGGLQSVYNNFAALLQDIRNTREVLSNISSTSTTWNPGPLTASSFASTSVTGLGSSIGTGDLCIAGFATDTPKSGSAIPMMDCLITGTGVATVQLHVASTTVDYSGTLNVRAFDLATFIAPDALTAATSSTAGE